MSVSLRQNDGGVWEIAWTEDRRSKRVSTRSRDRQAAEARLREWLRDRPASGSVAAILDAYLTEHAGLLAPERQAFAAAALRAGLGALRPEDLTADRIAAYKQGRRDGSLTGRKACDSTVRRELVCLVAALNHAIAQRRLSADRCPKILLPPKAAPKDIWLTESELAALLSVAAEDPHSRISRFTLIAAETGARKAAIQFLRWSQVDLASGVIHFQSDGERQTNKRRVAVPMSDALRASMTGFPRTSEWVLDTPTTIQHQWDALVERAADQTGIEKLREITPHTLRHTWATQAARAGVDLWQIAGVLGDTLETVSRNYMHHSPGHLRAAVNFRCPSETRS